MSDDRPVGEPMSAGRAGTPDASLRDIVLVIATFGLVVLINGILAIALIDLLETLGWWEASWGQRQP